jgi:hypothetical protein
MERRVEPSKERKQRQHPRFKAALPVELQLATMASPLRAQTLDIGLGGLYVEMSLTQKTSTELDIVMWIGDVKISAKGVVVSNHASFGNGIKFTHLPDESRKQLLQYLESPACVRVGQITLPR